MFCEDKVLRVYADKDALFNADGNTNLVSTNRVLGNADAFAGEFGISKNPESFASYGFRAYFTDSNRGVVCRLSNNGIEVISDYGMVDFFADNLSNSSNIMGSFDDDKSSYNISVCNLTSEWQNKFKGFSKSMALVTGLNTLLTIPYYLLKKKLTDGKVENLFLKRRRFFKRCLLHL